MGAKSHQNDRQRARLAPYSIQLYCEVPDNTKFNTHVRIGFILLPQGSVMNTIIDASDDLLVKGSAGITYLEKQWN